MIMIENLETIWDSYCEKKFNQIIMQLEKKIDSSLDENLKEIYYLSSLEVYKQVKKVETNGIFRELLVAMTDYYSNNYLNTSKKLFYWITGKKLYPEWILERFYSSAKLANQYDLIIKLSLMLLKKEVKKEIVHHLFNAYYYLKEYEKALEVFEKYREVFDDKDLSYVGLILIKLRKYKEAERILLTAYKRITGKEYQLNYEEYEITYKKKYLELKEKYMQNKIENQKELFEYGLSCLFSNDYTNALIIFAKIKKELEKAA